MSCFGRFKHGFARIDFAVASERKSVSVGDERRRAANRRRGPTTKRSTRNLKKRAKYDAYMMPPAATFSKLVGQLGEYACLTIEAICTPTPTTICESCMNVMTIGGSHLGFMRSAIRQ